MENTRKTSLFNLKFISVVILLFIFLSAFLSKTVYNFNMPAVTAALPEKGHLNQIELTTGIVSYRDTGTVYSPSAGVIGEVLVRGGEAVEKGRPLVKMDFESAVAELEKQIDACAADTTNKLNEIKIGRDKLRVDIEKLNLNIINTERKIEELKRKEYIADSVSDYELKQNETDILRAKENLEKCQSLYAAGTISLQELNGAEGNLTDLLNQNDNLKRIMDESIEKNAASLADNETDRLSQISESEYQLEVFKRDLEDLNLDIEAGHIQGTALINYKESRTEECLRQISDYKENSVVPAPENLTVISVNIDAGQYADAYQSLISFGLKEELAVECEVGVNNNFIAEGDICTLNNASHSLDGTVINVTPAENSKKITVSIPAAEVSAGETFNVRFEKESSESYILVPSEAVNKDADGYFLNVIKRRDGILGDEYYTEKLSVYTGASDLKNTAVISGMAFIEPVAVNASKPFAETETVRLENEVDFLEN